MLSFEDFVELREGAMSDKMAGQGLTGGLNMGSSVAGDVSRIGKALSVALGEYKSRTIAFLRGLHDTKIDAILDEMSAGQLNRVRNVFNKASEEESEGDILAPSIADSQSED